MILKHPTNPLHIAIAAFLLAVAVATIATAWGYQLIAGAQPCKLCYAERWPYYLGIPTMLMATIAAYRGWPAAITRGLFLIFALLMIYGFGLSLYHAGAEAGFWPGPADCSGDIASTTRSAADLLSQMQATKVVSCTEVTVRIFGLSLAAWNTVASAGLAVIALFAAFTRR